MEGFYKIVLLVAIILYVIIMTVIVMMMFNTSSAPFPPQSSVCPDHWKLATDSDTKCQIPTIGSLNTGGLFSTGTLKVPSGTQGYEASNSAIDFSNNGWTTLNNTKTSICNKRDWANANGIVWGGVSNTNSC